MANLSHLIFKKKVMKEDKALSISQRGDRKLIVTSLYDEKEILAVDENWIPPNAKKKCPVLVMDNIEMGIFNENAKQDKHFHNKATEIYTLLEGSMDIEVNKSIIHLEEGDTIIVHPKSIHKVISKKDNFLCQVIAVNSYGILDKFIVE